MLPKFDDVAISTYLSVLAKIRRPSMTPSASTPRSLSSRTMSAASLATSVAESTEMPTSAACRATASFTPSPRKAMSMPRLRADLDDARLLVGADPGEDGRVGMAVGQLVVAQALELGPGQDPADVETDVAADLGGDDAVVAGDDLDRDPEAARAWRSTSPASAFGRSTKVRKPTSRRSRSSAGSARIDAGAAPRGDRDDPGAVGEEAVERVVRDRLAGRRSGPGPPRARPW